MRDLATIVTIEKTWALEGKDRVQGASFKENGYEAMVGKDLKEGDLVCFIQEGAILPVKEEWEFLRTKCFKENLNGFLIKPMKFASIKSWGLVVQISDVEELKQEKNLKPGKDITELLQIRKYEDAEDASPTVKDAWPAWIRFCYAHTCTKWIGKLWVKNHTVSGGFPSDLISKSDETTVQNYKGVLEKFAEEQVYVTAKLEGQSFTVAPTFKGKKCTGAYVCSRNNAFKKQEKNMFWDMMFKYDIEKKMKELWKHEKKAYIIQGEQVGEGIQNNIYDFKGNKWFAFTVKDYSTGKQLSLEEAGKVSENVFGIPFVPILQSNVKLKEIMPTIEEAVAYAERKCWLPLKSGKIDFNLDTNYLSKKEKLWTDYLQHEGVVVRSMNYDKDNNVGFSMKIKNFQYSEKSLGKIHEICINIKKK